jgi:quercetin dioxygenase-like cupin family protein
MIETEATGDRTLTMRVYGDDPGGRVAIVEMRVVEGEEMPRHLHTNEDELLSVLDGVVAVWVGDMLHRLQPGGYQLLRRGTEHGDTVESREAHLLIVLLPAESERFFQEVRALLTTDGLEGVIGVAARYGIAITGPGGGPE